MSSNLLKKSKESFWFERSTKSDTCIGFPSTKIQHYSHARIALALNTGQRNCNVACAQACAGFNELECCGYITSAGILPPAQILWVFKSYHQPSLVRVQHRTAPREHVRVDRRTAPRELTRDPPPSRLQRGHACDEAECACRSRLVRHGPSTRPRDRVAQWQKTSGARGERTRSRRRKPRPRGSRPRGAAYSRRTSHRGKIRRCWVRCVSC